MKRKREETKRTIMESNTEKKVKRKQILEKKKATLELIMAASAQNDALASFPSFRYYNRNGLSVYLESSQGNMLSSTMKQYIQHLLKVNMEGPYGSEWPTEQKVKRWEMIAPGARYILVHQAPNAGIIEISTSSCMENIGPLVGFVQYRFTLEEEIPVLYVYEIQLESCVQGKGLGKFLMQLVELIACKNRIGAVMLTVQKANLSAMNFYISKLRYNISSISPSKVDPMNKDERSYEILCKAFDNEARSTLEASV